MRIEDYLKFSTEDLEKMSDEELTNHFSHYLTITNPLLLKVDQKIHRESFSPTKITKQPKLPKMSLKEKVQLMQKELEAGL